MKLGQTSVVLFLSKILTSVLGFLAMVYFGRVLGPESLGVYFLAITVVSWLGFVGTMGFRLPTKKRVSEYEADQDEFIIASLLIALTSFVVLAVLLYLFRSQVNDYIGLDVMEYIVVILFSFIMFRLVSSVLQGQNFIHLFAGVRVVRKGGQVIFQIGAVLLGFSVVGLLAGYALGAFVALVIGGYLISANLKYPKKHHFTSLYSYAKYSWAQSFQTRTFSYMDTLILGFFVTADFVGIYQISWQIASFLVIFGSSIAQTLFPEISEESSAGNEGQVAAIFRESVAYSGLFIIPGLMGGVLLAPDILRIYGEEFAKGAIILPILLLSRLIHAYYTQFINTINAMDRPELGFRINISFVVANMTLNVVLIYLYGWIGAAVATTVSSCVAFALGHYYVEMLLSVDWPVREVSKQWISASVMGTVLYFAMEMSTDLRPVTTQEIDTVLLVGGGGFIYFTVLIAISSSFRRTVLRNSPI